MPGRYGFLSHLTALDLTDEKGSMAGRILADLGARVIKVEPPGGDPGRSSGPRVAKVKSKAHSMVWLSYNHNKESITLDLARPEGTALFKQLAAKADVVIESFAPGHMDSLGLGFEALRAVNPGIVLTSITAFGQSGPYKDYRASDLTLMALGGIMNLIGDPDRPPVRVSIEQAVAHGCSYAAVGTLMAHAARMQTGEGSHVDCSILDSLILPIGSALPAWEVDRAEFKREGSRMVTTVSRRSIYPCKDGHLAFLISFGKNAVPFMTPLVQWMKEVGMAGGLEHVDIQNTKIEQVAKEQLSRYEDDLLRFFMTKTKAQIREEAVKRRLLADAISTVADICADPQLQARSFFTNVRHPDLGRDVLHPGTFILCPEERPLPTRPAPRPGEHNAAVYGGILNLAPRRVAKLKAQGAI
ncbi:MAG: CoA transferase [Chloroflexi bacterium]|nr:CoA transferase [Chloroflexota bacterium]